MSKEMSCSSSQASASRMPNCVPTSGKKDMMLARQPLAGWSTSTRKKAIVSLKKGSIRRENISLQKVGSFERFFQLRPSSPSFKKHSNEFYLAILNRNRELVSL